MLGINTSGRPVAFAIDIVDSISTYIVVNSYKNKLEESGYKFNAWMIINKTILIKIAWFIYWHMSSRFIVYENHTGNNYHHHQHFQYHHLHPRRYDYHHHCHYYYRNFSQAWMNCIIVSRKSIEMSCFSCLITKLVTKLLCVLSQRM